MVERKPAVPGKMVRSGPSRSQSAVALTPKEVVGILRRHVFMIVILTLFGVAAGGASWYLLKRYFPRYTAQTLIEVLSPVETDPMTIVAQRMQQEIEYGHRVSMANLIKQQGTFQDLLRNDKVKATKWFANRDRDIRNAFAYLKKHFGAYPHRDAQFVQLSMTCGIAKEAQLIVNEMTSLFLSSQGGKKQSEVGERLKQLEERKTRIEAELRQAEDAMEDVRRTSGISDLQMPTGRYFQHTITLRLNDLELQENELELAISQLRANIANFQELATGPVTVQIERIVERDPVMVALAQQIAFQEAHLSGRLARFGENHRVVRQTRELIDEIEERRRLRQAEIADQTRQANLKDAQQGLIVFQQRLEELQNLRAEAAAEKKDLDQARVQYEQRMKIRDERILTLDAVKTQIEKLKIMVTDPETPKVRIAGLAPEPLEMVTSRQWWLWFPSGTMLGFLLGIGLAFLVEMLNDLVRTPSDVARFLHIPLLGVIPDADEDREVRDVDLYQVVRQAPYSVMGESYRRTRTNLELSSPGKSLKTLLVTSGDAEDGKTSVAVNLAMAFVAKSKKVLLIDANFRQPSLRAAFPKTAGSDTGAGHSDSGLSGLLTGQCGYAEAVRPSGIKNLAIIDSGVLPPNPAELLASADMETLIKEQGKNYDHIVIDSPPILLVSDAKVLAKLVDGTVIVFNAAATRRGAAQRTIFELRQMDANVVGCVLFAARAIKGGYFRQQYKSYRRYQPQVVGSA
ncbi:MAG: polysaccharide biosynthesis tyrosine autokinase [Phycisphaerales bacterium]|nr:MAG: polysaccharide biosynthesis tyrosine autokinase [Phycisphaerales bacterium]